ncbi:hypothetical protein MJO28_013471 [Puccinia striiformis f. sp. tritici]|uniref:Uncharacterized protein n=1 Tax=Puccinia striiformis f. sp. tritici TaxID=168172 RepID=A0ACC0DYL0_9BASI|nr:hypothetical protein Pst134EB_024753 [Puccinia striiformis f. sp. tritici]KAI7941186.1 hypothetical protein MJO28_013471 [Puccinia striiformis f. sp. tritici]KAI7942776.1 hypothetical protein MJO29_012620 [Puccinia striiformis f. sp. tritici]
MKHAISLSLVLWILVLTVCGHPVRELIDTNGNKFIMVKGDEVGSHRDLFEYQFDGPTEDGENNSLMSGCITNHSKNTVQIHTGLQESQPLLLEPGHLGVVTFQKDFPWWLVSQGHDKIKLDHEAYKRLTYPEVEKIKQGNSKSDSTGSDMVDSNPLKRKLQDEGGSSSMNSPPRARTTARIREEGPQNKKSKIVSNPPARLVSNDGSGSEFNESRGYRRTSRWPDGKVLDRNRIITIKHHGTIYKIAKANGWDAPIAEPHLFAYDGRGSTSHNSALLFGESHKTVRIFAGIPGNHQVLKLPPGKIVELEYRENYPWVLTSTDPKAILNQKMYDLLVGPEKIKSKPKRPTQEVYKKFYDKLVTPRNKKQKPSQTINGVESPDDMVTNEHRVITVIHHGKEYKIAKADGYAGPDTKARLFMQVGTPYGQENTAAVLSLSDVTLRIFSGIPGDDYVTLEPQSTACVKYQKDYPWVLASADPEATLDKTMYDRLVTYSNINTRPKRI